ncbi:hypothetical protein [Ramlibacter rhizophilus]|uniref:hypothetical protein n=1 Tax=Ramlibacter rhizophilus TaxID=1781167 RepID=UPI00143236D5|nr:hypothetical protein [Ramlibacter rhizophilus]
MFASSVRIHPAPGAARHWEGPVYAPAAQAPRASRCQAVGLSAKIGAAFAARETVSTALGGLVRSLLVAALAARAGWSDEDAALVALGSVLVLTLGGCCLMSRATPLLGEEGFTSQLAVAAPLALSVDTAAWYLRHDAQDQPAGLPLAASVLVASLGRMAGNLVRDAGNQLVDKALPGMTLQPPLPMGRGREPAPPLLVDPRITRARLVLTCVAYFALIVANRSHLTPALQDWLEVDPEDRSLRGRLRGELAASAGVVALEAVHAFASRLWTGLVAASRSLAVQPEPAEGLPALARNLRDAPATWLRVREHAGMRTWLGVPAELAGSAAISLAPDSAAARATEIARCALLVLIDLRSTLVERGHWQAEVRRDRADGAMELRALLGQPPPRDEGNEGAHGYA